MTVLTFVEHDRGRLAEPPLQALTLAREVAAQLGAPLEVAVPGGAGAALAGRLGAHGAQTVHVLEHGLLDDYAPEAWAESLVQLLAAVRPVAVVAAGTERGNEVLAHVAARTDLPLAANCTAVTATGDEWELTRVRWGGSLLEDAALAGAVKLVTVAPHAVDAVAASGDGAAPAVTSFAPELSGEHARTRVRERTSRGEGVTLATAPVVVSGGRGVGGPEGFTVLEELADLLGGAVGCSRVATNAGWRPHSDQVGQTGTRVAPDLYLACGISGAIQHRVGCMGAKHLLAINTDPEAPLVAVADSAAIGDLHEILPAVVDELRARRTRATA